MILPIDGSASSARSLSLSLPEEYCFMDVTSCSPVEVR